MIGHGDSTPRPLPTTHHRPQRGDDVEAWLVRMRDRHGAGIDKLLDRYRECADYGLSLRPEDDGAGDP